MDIRVGIGYDVHRFAEGRRLFLCGVEFENSPGLDGHSDADVALHAVTDAVLGAVGAGDIGSWFPDTDMAYKGADSRELLRTVMQSEALQGWQLINLDMVIITQQPKILPMVERMKESLSGLLNTTVDRISIKGKTTEKLGFTGRGEGIAVHAAVLMQRI
jgi:2-C-methyl-D-erythritol 2,4-cyclodiphosphate synthase